MTDHLDSGLDASQMRLETSRQSHHEMASESNQNKTQICRAQIALKHLLPRDALEQRSAKE